MMHLKIVCLRAAVILFVFGICAISLLSQSVKIEQGTLIAPGSEPFHLKAAITDDHDDAPLAYVEIFWVSPDKWRRTIKSQEFSQTLIVNGGKVFEQHSDNYFPFRLKVLVTAMVDPKPVLDAHRPDDILETKANGAANESGRSCYKPGVMAGCTMNPDGLNEIVGAPGHIVSFAAYKKFHGKRIARRVVNQIDREDFQTAEITELSDLTNADESLFAIAKPTPPAQVLRDEFVSESELRTQLQGTPEIIWPQMLDGAITGKASFLVELDPSGKVRDVIPIHNDNYSSSDSAIRQIKRWKFNPAIKDGAPAQAEGVLTFDVNTRAYPPYEPLTDEQVRKLATNIVEPTVPSGLVPPGTDYKLQITVDTDGVIAEKIAVGGPPQLFGPCDQALMQWHFRPIMDNGQPRSYRGVVVFHIP
jgi:hypothetical protein